MADAAETAGRQHATRDAIWSLLSEQDVGRVSRREGGSVLIEGDEYLDLEHVHEGVRRKHTRGPTAGDVLPRNALEAATWSKICARLVPPHVAR
jgi:hypothetical protein